MQPERRAGSSLASTAALVVATSGGNGSHGVAPPIRAAASLSTGSAPDSRRGRRDRRTLRAGDHRILEAELLAGVEERRAAQREQQHGRGARSRLGAIPRALPGVVVVRQHPRRPRGDRIEHRDRRSISLAMRAIPRRRRAAGN